MKLEKNLQKKACNSLVMFFVFSIDEFIRALSVVMMDKIESRLFFCGIENADTEISN